jgi:hypothetical protein
MLDGSDAVSDWPLLNALLNTAGGATWVSLHHGGGVGMGYSQHSGMVIVADGSARRPSGCSACWERQRLRRDAPCRRRLPRRRRMRETERPEAAHDQVVRSPDFRRTILPTMQKNMTFTIEPGRLTLPQLRAAWLAHSPLALAPEADAAIAASARAVRDIVARGAAAYGINTGFGKLAKARIADDRLEELQRNLILSHAVGTGELIADEAVRLIVLMKVASLARGYSGVRPLIIETLIALYNAGIMPAIPAQGSVGASGDLAPLAHMTLAMIGVGQVRWNGELCDAQDALTAPGSQAGDAGGEGRPRADQRHAGLDRAGARTACSWPSGCTKRAWSPARCRSTRPSGSDAPFDARIHAVRGQPGQMHAPRCIASCSTAARSAARTWSATSACRTRTACAASRR